MNKNTLKKLAGNPHYSMSNPELEELSKLLNEEAEEAKKEEKTDFRKVNKNRVHKSFPEVEKTRGLEEQGYDRE